MSDLVDTQNERDERGLAIQRVGVKAVRYPLTFEDKDKETQNTVATLSLAVNLPKDVKGTHMSRFVEALNDNNTPLSVSSIDSLTLSLLKRLPAEEAHVNMRFPYFRNKPAPVTQKSGLLYYEVELDITTAKNSETSTIISVYVPVTTLCPCSKAISQYGAHNQRGVVTLSVKATSSLWIEDLIQLIEESASAQLYSLLKRDDEKFVTEQAYENPVFVEDLVRNVATKVETITNISWYRVEAENYESIHNHNAYAVIESTQ